MRLDLHVAHPGLVVHRAFHQAVARFCQALEVQEGCLVEVTLADDQAISAVHLESLGVPGPTDCVAFPGGFGGQGGPFLGAFYMGVDEVARNAAERHEPFNAEVAFVLAHGLLHLLDWEDDTPAKKAAMFARQGELVAGLREAHGRIPRLLSRRAAR